MGYQTLEVNTTGDNNVAVGYKALNQNTTGANNVAVGYGALNLNTTGNQNTVVGTEAGGTLTTGSNNIIIGYYSQPSSATVYNEVTIGSSSNGTYRYYGSSWTNPSDARDKKDIVTLENGLDFVSKLNPVSFVWNMRDGGKVDVPSHGFIAQELQQVQKDTGLTIPDLVYESNPDRLEAGYSTLLPIMVKSIQELKTEVDSLKAELAALKG